MRSAHKCTPPLKPFVFSAQKGSCCKWTRDVSRGHLILKRNHPLWSKIEKKKHKQNSYTINHYPPSKGVSKVCGMSGRANGQASGPVLTCGFLIILAHCVILKRNHLLSILLLDTWNGFFFLRVSSSFSWAQWSGCDTNPGLTVENARGKEAKSLQKWREKILGFWNTQPSSKEKWEKILKKDSNCCTTYTQIHTHTNIHTHTHTHTQTHTHTLTHSHTHSRTGG